MERTRMPATDRFVIQRRFPTYAFILVTTAAPRRVAATLEDRFGIQSQCTPVRVMGSDSTAARARFAFPYPLPMRRFGVRVDGVAVPSVAGSNVYVRVRLVKSLLAIELTALATVAASMALSLELEFMEMFAAGSVAFLLFGAIAGFTFSRVSQVKRMLQAALPGW